jgi:hypothetical protein
MGDSQDRRERDFIRLAVIVGIVFAILVGIEMISVFGPVRTTFGPMEDDHVESAGPSE